MYCTVILFLCPFPVMVLCCGFICIDVQAFVVPCTHCVLLSSSQLDALSFVLGSGGVPQDWHVPQCAPWIGACLIQDGSVTQVLRLSSSGQVLQEPKS
jgi:hypothetical protein